MASGHEYKKIDYTTIFIYGLIVFFGWLNIYAVCYNANHAAVFDLTVQHGKQLIWIVLSAIVATVILLTEPRFFSNTAYIIYVGAMMLLVATLFVGAEINGAKSWIVMGGVSIQSSEFSKFSTALALAKVMSSQDIDLKTWRSWMTIGVVIAIPVGLIFLQHDMGSALVFSAFLVPLYRFGMNPTIIVLGTIAVLIFFSTLLLPMHWVVIIMVAITLAYLFIWIGKPRRKDYLTATGLLAGSVAFALSVNHVFNLLDTHQQNRIRVLLDPTLDRLGVGYNVHQAKLAIGSGGFWGKGFLHGTITTANFIPEQETDFIFCTVGEEWGFVGCAVLVLLYSWLLQRLITMAERQTSPFSRFYGYSVSAIFFFHLLVNIGMVLGLVPVIGIPLPFFSYGGSSILAFTILLFIFIRQDASHTSML